MPLIVAPLPPPPSSPMSLYNATLGGSPARAALTSPNHSPSKTSRTAMLGQGVSTSVIGAEVQNTRGEDASRFPTVTLDAEGISDVMAARLTICLLGHVLYLKSQVPFPVAQLMRMTLARKADSREAKKQDALLTAFDILSSHLGSTFTALSATLAHRATNSCLSPVESTVNITSTPTTATTHLAIILGPSVTSASAARARIVLELDGLRVQRWSGRSTFRPRVSLNGHLKENMVGVHHTERAKNGEDTATPESGGLRSRGLRNALRDISAEPESNRKEGVDDIESVPDSDLDSASTDGNTDSEAESEIEDENEDENESEETEADLCAAERLLSRTLAIANADPELGLAAELHPTQIHILLRAPRRFSHPAWIPRQNLTRDMDFMLRAFVYSAPTGSNPSQNSAPANLHDITNSARAAQPVGARPANAKPTNARQAAGRKGGLKTECVRVRCRADATRAMPCTSVVDGEDRCESRDSDNGDEEEDESDGDEMIWWSWDGKLEGFSDW